MALGNQSSTDNYELLDLSVRKNPTDLLTSNQYNNNTKRKHSTENIDYYTKKYKKFTINTNCQSEKSSTSTDTAEELSQSPNNKNNNCNVKHNPSDKLPIFNQTPLKDESVIGSGFHQNSIPTLSVNEAPMLESNAPNSNKVSVEYHNQNSQSQCESRIKLILPPKKRPRDLSMFAEDTVQKPIVTNFEQDGSKKNKNMKKKFIKPPCKCVFKCYLKINYTERLYIYQQFGALTDKQAQLDFLLTNTEKYHKVRDTDQDTEKKRLSVFKYKLPLRTQDRAVKVCKKMFLNTLMISSKLVKIAWNGVESVKELKHTKGRMQDKVIVKTMVKSVRDHCNSFTPITSQYQGENITKLYLDGSLTTSRMFTLYKEWIDPNKYVRRVKTEKQYRDLLKKNIDSGLLIFNSDHNKQTDCFIQNNSSTTVTENKYSNSIKVCEDDETSKLYTNNITSVTFLADDKEHDVKDMKDDQPSFKELQYGTETNLISFNNSSEYHNHSVTSSDIKCNYVETVQSSLKDNLNGLEQNNSEVTSVATSPLFTSDTSITLTINIADIPLPPEKLEENICQTDNLSPPCRKVENSSQKHSLPRYEDNLGDSIERPCGCNFKCTEKINNNEQKNIYVKYTDLGDEQKQFDFIITFTEKYKKKRWISRNIKNIVPFAFKYKLPTSKGPTVNVCKKMFMNTLSVNDNTVKTAWEKFEERLRNKIPDTIPNIPSKNMYNIFKTMVKSVRDHVNSFVPVETHFLGRKSNKLYLDGSLNVSQMFKLYNEWLDPNKYFRRVETEKKYKHIISKHFNLGFYTIKKDECDQCQSFRKLSIPSDEQTARHIIHTQTIVTAHNKKNQDISEASVSNGNIISAIFDIEKLLPCPHGQECLFYNKRKLLCFNFPILDMSSKRPVCYMWDECVAKNGANEVSSCLFDFLNTNIEKGVDEFRFWSENDESRNQSIFYVYITVAFTNKVNISHNFHVKDHVQSEVTSVHSVIEKVSSSKHIFTPEEWKILVKWTRTNCQEPYKVIDMTQNNFYDFQSQVNALQWYKNTEGKTVAWNEVREVFISSDDPSKIKFRYDYNQEFEVIETGIHSQPLEISRAYRKILPLCHAKYKDLMFLCDNGIIPKGYIDFYKKLPHISDN